jgi:hypothetical protein
MSGLAARDAAGVPAVGFAAGELLRRTGDTEAIVGLASTAARRSELPTQTGRELVDPERVDEIFAAEVSEFSGGHEFEAVVSVRATGVQG